MELPTGSYTSFAAVPDGSRVLALDPINAAAIDIHTGESIVMPVLVRTLPITMDYGLDDSGRLFITNPGDGVEYAVGTLRASQLDAGADNPTVRRLDNERVFVSDDLTVAVQGSATGPVFAVPTVGATDLGVFDSLLLPDGRVVALIGSKLAKGWTTELVVVNQEMTTRMVVQVSARYPMANYLAVVSGTVVVANPSDAGLTLTAYSI